MQEISGSLSEVIRAYSDHNLLVPAATDVQLNPFYKYHVEEVAVDLSENSGDIFKVGSVKTGKTDSKGNDIWQDTYSLSKPLLNKLAMAAGIQFNPHQTYGRRIDSITYRAQAQGAMRKADGTYRSEVDQKEICLEDEEDKYRTEFSDKAVKGITDKKATNAAAEIFKGSWVDTKDKWGKKVKAYVIDEADRERYVERSVKVNMALLKKTWAEKAMTGAKLRVIRALLGTKGSYTKDELKKNFAIPTVIFSPDYSDPQVRQAMLMQGMNSVNNMFGMPQIEVKNVDFATDSNIIDEGDLDNPAFTSELPDEDMGEIQQEAFGAFLDVICETFNNQGIPSLIDMNGAHFDAITDYPQLAHGDVDKRDITKLSTFLKDMVGVGILIPDEDLEDYVREVANLPERTLSDDPRNKDEQREAQRRSPEKEGKTSEVEPEENQEIEEAKKRLGR